MDFYFFKKIVIQLFSQHIMMKSLRHETDNKIECNIINSIINIFRLKKEIDHPTINARKNLFKLKKK